MMTHICIPVCVMIACFDLLNRKWTEVLSGLSLNVMTHYFSVFCGDGFQ